ncbi:MAG TPA: UDP-glucose/GDP-mannose dehydrogenase family protein, partial [Candidatus Polarisedimenticolia bacterium]|nr:UDP-glucose/GDP-mannose dehydrogenase family protein [Candidatus Polarisedimenticolia bacterium]
MRIVVVGTGYVGLVSGAGLADFGNEVLCVDVDRSKIDLLERGEIPFYEPGLKDLVARNIRERRLRFSTSLEQATRWGEVVFICVGTPPRRNGTADLRFVFDAAKKVAQAMPGYRLIVQKSTVPVGTGDQVQALMKKHVKRGVSFDVASNPEFLREGTAVENFMRPDRIVIGANTERARKLLRSIYAPLYLLETPTLVTNVRTAELLKYAANAFLATKISFVNEMANLAEAVGADIKDVAKGMGLDRRIGPKFLHPGPGFGGSCLPKDTVALRAFAKAAGVPLRIVAGVIETNKAQRQIAVDKTLAALKGRGPHTAAILGLSYKPDTDDMREAPSLDIIRALLRKGARVRAYDPAVRRGAPDLPEEVVLAASAYDAAKGADVLVLVTEWNQFRKLDLVKVRRAMRRRAIVDLRNIYDPETVKKLGFTYT